MALLPKVEISDVQKSQPEWLNTRIGEGKVTIPYGVTVENNDFPEVEGKRIIASGVVLGRTYAEKEAKTGYSKAADGDEEVCVAMFQEDLNQVAAIAALAPNSGNAINVNFLPEWDTLAAPVKALVYANYVCVNGNL